MSGRTGSEATRERANVRTDDTHTVTDDDRNRRLQALLFLPVVVAAAWTVYASYDPGEVRSGTVLPAFLLMAVGYVVTARLAARFG
ncbi:hypothetical protein [Halosegnis marinus]|uniref:Uncharacterized protein n=1 Tax=Halosegnis marinus TaxID=3034023 RepID=A0ABD5ZL46_9EURY|nr:hypothetical protein [Halosegnis sp. DT85]